MISNSTKEFLDEATAQLYDRMLAAGQTDVWPRGKAEFTALFDGLELVEPGVVSVGDWRDENEPQPRPTPTDISVLGGVARLP